jgi:hypothetical protein
MEQFMDVITLQDLETWELLIDIIDWTYLNLSVYVLIQMYELVLWKSKVKFP